MLIFEKSLKRQKSMGLLDSNPTDHNKKAPSHRSAEANGELSRALEVSRDAEGILDLFKAEENEAQEGPN